MQGILKYKLPQDNYEFELAQKAFALLQSLNNILLFLREKLKHEDISELEFKIYEETRAKIIEILKDEEVIGLLI